MKRGEVWIAATGSGFGGKPRPVVVVQGQTYGETPNLVVALCLTASGQSNEVRPRISPDSSNGLREVSDIAVDLLVIVPRSKFGRPVGNLTAPDMNRVDTALLTMLGFAELAPK